MRTENIHLLLKAASAKLFSTAAAISATLNPRGWHKYMEASAQRCDGATDSAKVQLEMTQARFASAGDGATVVRVR